MYSLADLPAHGCYPYSLTKVHYTKPCHTGTHFLLDYLGRRSLEIEKNFQVLVKILTFQAEGSDKFLLTLLTELYDHHDRAYKYGEERIGEEWFYTGYLADVLRERALNEEEE